MQSLFSVLQEYEVKTAPNIKSERAEILQKFLDKLNADRGAYKPITAKRLSMMLSDAQLKTPADIYTFYRQCENAKHFSRFFWWSLKAK